jgi:hypothetical protein
MNNSGKKRYCFHCVFKNGIHLPAIVSAEDEVTARIIVDQQAVQHYGEAPVRVELTPHRKFRNRSGHLRM